MRKRVDLWYPRVDDPKRVPDHPVEVEIELVDVRAANSIVVDYDFDRDGYRIRMEKMSDDDDASDNDAPYKEILVEVAFVPAWASGAPKTPC